MTISQSMDFQFLAENSVDVICRTAPDTRLLYVSPSSFRNLGWKPEEMTGKPAVDFIFREDLASVQVSIDECNAPGVESVTSTIRFVRKDGALVWMEVNARAVRDEAGEPIEHVIVMRDITARKELEERLMQQAQTDGLTGLANRRAFDEALDRNWQETLRTGSQISLLFLDIDHFKKFNDEYGHQFGDDCLRAVAQAVARTVGDAGMVARYGGEEIAVILPDSDAVYASEVAEKMRVAVEALKLLREDDGKVTPCVTVSVGVATAFSRHGGTIRMPESLIMAADNALYKAKHGGRNQLSTALVMAVH